MINERITQNRRNLINSKVNELNWNGHPGEKKRVIVFFSTSVLDYLFLLIWPYIEFEQQNTSSCIVFAQLK